MAEFHEQNELSSTLAPNSSKQPLNSISTRIIFFVFLSTFLTALVVSWISIDTIHRNLRRQIEARFPAILERRITAFDAYLTEGHESLSERVRAADLAPLALARHPDARRIGRSLRKLEAASPRFAGMLLQGPTGTVLGSSGDVTALADITVLEASYAPIFSALGVDHTALALAQIPLNTPGSADAEGRVEGEPGARLIGIFELSPLAPSLSLEPDEGSGRIRLLSTSGLVLLGHEDTIESQEAVLIPASAFDRTGDGGVKEYIGEMGDHRLASAGRLGSADWILVVEAPFKEVFAPVLSVVKRVFLTDLGIILLFSFLAYRVTAAIMQPIEALSEGAARISQGDVEHEIPTPKTNDEIGLLTRTFNDMMRKLRQSQLEIEADKRRLTEQNEELHRANEVLAQLSITDGLTKLHNHRYFQDHLTREIKRLSRTGESLSMILIDLDDFKQLNDRHGHAAGDEVLVSIAGLMNDSVRESDLLARYGGEEFVILAPNTDIHGAVAIAEKIRMTVESSSQIVDDSMRPIKLTISCGVAQYRGNRKQFFQTADGALYDAKRQGKNCVFAREESP
jgi:diguanylate cyclase (GGDEF)-like protein